ncbi:MAG: WecB/TagA/CpsF family glycosyltransferase [Halothece sp. Uz-M2-17]|nr:WecB/TagA/CpsF family glycosyltransferase [Halothece sp. Uz-M2-17]
MGSRQVIKSQIHATSYTDACDRIVAWAKQKRSCYVIPANVHVVMTAFWQKHYQTVVNDAALVTPDGMPLVWGLRLLGVKRQQRVYGPDLMLACCDRAAKEKIPIYLYGSTPDVLTKLKDNLQQWYPNLIIAGSHSPAFRPLSPEETEEEIKQINDSGSAIVFVALGCPKQEAWMAQQVGNIQGVMIGVGAAFAFHSQQTAQAPRWLMKLGLEWLYRLATEPRRLWRRYLINNPAFLILFTLQLIQYWTLFLLGLKPKHPSENELTK